MRIIGIVALALCAIASGCANTQGTTNSAQLAALDFSSNTGQNAQLSPDGFVNVGSTQLDSGLIDPSVVNWQGTAVSGILSINKNGVQVKNPGNLDADSLEIVFGEPMADADGALIVPISTITIAGLTNEVTTVIEASTEQVLAWVGVLDDLSEDQRDAILAELEAQKVISSSFAETIRAALEAATPIP
jgi:hypothetical protein